MSDFVLAKIIVWDDICVTTHPVSDESLFALNGYYESEFFFVNKSLSLDKLFDFIIEKVAPHVQHMKCDNFQIIFA